ncbi:hypothetical protein BVI1335_2460011 [Burkholderia vietnamiensis]|nr:hypothetical protein BVI1335_2460011 [Burkholderia vietnamiensis]
MNHAYWDVGGRVRRVAGGVRRRCAAAGGQLARAVVRRPGDELRRRRARLGRRRGAGLFDAVRRVRGETLSGADGNELLCVRKRTFSALRGAELGAACRVDRVFQRRTRAGHQLARGGRSDAARRLTRERTKGGREAESGAAGNPAGARVIWNGGAAGAS